MNRLSRCVAALGLLAAAVLPPAATANPVVNPLEDTSVFPIAVWAMPSSTAAPFAEMGVNLFVAGAKNAPGWCDTLAMSNCVGFVHWNSRRTPEQRAEIVASPGFLGWMHGDEPDNPGVVDDVFRITRIPPARLQAAYEEMRASTTPAPMYLNLGQGLANGINQSTPDSVYPAFCRAADIVCYDVYPTSTQENGLERLHLVARGVERLRRFAGPDKPVWVWLECTAIHDGHAGIGNRAPLPHEVRAEVWMALVHGADGIGWFPHSFEPYRGGPDAIPLPVREEMARTNRLLHHLAPVLRAGQRQRLEVSRHEGRIAATLWRFGEQQVLVAVNMRAETSTAALHLPPGCAPMAPLGNAAGSGLRCSVPGEPAPAGSGATEPQRLAAGGIGLPVLELRPYEVALFAAGLDLAGPDLPDWDYAYPAPAPPAPRAAAPAPAATVAALPVLRPAAAGITWSRTPRTRLAVPHLAAAPTVDGDPTDAVWSLAAPLAPLTNTAGSGAPAAPTEVRLGQRDGTLYLGWRATEPHLDSLVTHRPAAWRNDCVEIWLDPDNRRTSFAHLIATSTGRVEAARTVQDGWGEGERDEGWSPRVVLQTGRGAGAWTGELAIELADVTSGDWAPAGSSAVWGFDLARERKPAGGENSVWTLGRFNGAAYFGEIILAPAGAGQAHLLLAGGALLNPGPRPLAAQVEIRVAERRPASRYARWDDQWTDLAAERRTVEVPAAAAGQPGRADLLTGDLAIRVPARGRVALVLLGPAAGQFEEFIANLPGEPAAED